MHFQIFLPDSLGTTRNKVEEELLRVGLGHLTEGAVPREIREGPDGQPGCLIGFQTAKGETNHGFHPESQDWVPAIADGDGFPAARYWVGFEKFRDPTPEQLARRYQYHGELVPLGDGKAWRIPRAAALPFDMIRADDGSTQFIPQRKLHQFVMEALEWKRVLLAVTPGGECSYEALRNFVELGLHANYRLTPEVADRLKLFSSGASGSVLKAAFSICAPELPEDRFHG